MDEEKEKVASHAHIHTDATARRYQQCNRGCGSEIEFDANNKSQSGKWIH